MRKKNITLVGAIYIELRQLCSHPGYFFDRAQAAVRHVFRHGIRSFLEGYWKRMSWDADYTQRFKRWSSRQNAPHFPVNKILPRRKKYPPIIDRQEHLAEARKIFAQAAAGTVLEIAFQDKLLVSGADVMTAVDKRFSNVTYRHDPAHAPWPIPDKKYDMAVALQSWHALDGCQQKAFRELMRVSKQAILSFPYKWDLGEKDNRSGIDDERIAAWTLNVPPVSVTRAGIRVVYHFNFGDTLPEALHASDGSGLKVSVIIGIKDRYDQRIRNALHSLRTQTCDAREVEIILVDYGSEERHHPEFEILCREFNAIGVWTALPGAWNRAHCLNIGIRRAKAPFILFSDVDVVFAPNYIEECMKRIRRSPDEAYFSRMNYLPEDVCLQAGDVPAALEQFRNKSFQKPEAFWGQSILFVKTEALTRIRGFDEYYRLWGEEDIDLYDRLYLMGIHLQELDACTFHLHQWHPWLQGVAEHPHIKTQMRANLNYRKTRKSIIRNGNGWGELKPDDVEYYFPEKPCILPGTLWGITTFFNPCRYRNKKRNYDRFRKESLDQGLKLAVVELAFYDEPFELGRDDADILIQLRAGKAGILWQKEALLNIALSALPAECDKIVWLDCDIIFLNNDWVAGLARLLEHYVVVQPFSEAARLSALQSEDPRRQFSLARGMRNELGMVFAVQEHGRSVLSADNFRLHGNQGFAWACRRSLMDRSPFLDFMVLGSADLLMAHAFYYSSENLRVRTVLPTAELQALWCSWKEVVGPLVQGSVSFLPGTILHLYHGDPADRLYDTRDEILRRWQFDPLTDIRKNADGIWEWATDKPGLHEEIRQYFMLRREDNQG